jgi:hypothetical protein
MSQIFKPLESSGPIPPIIATSYVTDSGTAVPSANILNVITSGNGITDIGSGNTITFSLTSEIINYTAITHNGSNPSPYTVTLTDYYISVDTKSVTPGTVTILLPNAPIQYRTFIIKDRTGGASANNISITTVGGAVTIDGETTYTLAGNYGAIELLFNGTSYEVY